MRRTRPAPPRPDPETGHAALNAWEQQGGDACNNPHSRPLLVWAAALGRHTTLESLLKATTHAPDVLGQALHWALAYQEAKTKASTAERALLARSVRALMDAGAPPRAAERAAPRTRRLSLAATRWNSLWDHLPDATVTALLLPRRKNPARPPDVRWLARAALLGNTPLLDRLWRAASPAERSSWCASQLFQRALVRRNRSGHSEADREWLIRLIEHAPQGSFLWKKPRTTPSPIDDDPMRLWRKTPAAPPFHKLGLLPYLLEHDPSGEPVAALLRAGGLDATPAGVPRLIAATRCFVLDDESRDALVESGWRPYTDDEWQTLAHTAVNLPTAVGRDRERHFVPDESMLHALKTFQTLGLTAQRRFLVPATQEHGTFLDLLITECHAAKASERQSWLVHLARHGYLDGGLGGQALRHAVGPWPEKHRPHNGQDRLAWAQDIHRLGVDPLGYSSGSEDPTGPGATLLHQAMVAAYPEVTAWLMEACPALIHAPDGQGRTPLHLLMGGRVTERTPLHILINQLQQANARADVSDANGQTPLHAYARDGDMLPPNFEPWFARAAYAPDLAQQTPFQVLIERWLRNPSLFRIGPKSKERIQAIGSHWSRVVLTFGIGPRTDAAERSMEAWLGLRDELVQNGWEPLLQAAQLAWAAEAPQERTVRRVRPRM